MCLKPLGCCIITVQRGGLTLRLLCFHSAAAHMPLVHAGGMGGVVRTHRLQLHLLRYEATHAGCSQRAQTEGAARDSCSVAASTSPAEQSSSARLFPCGDLDESHSVQMCVALCLFPKHVVARCMVKTSWFKNTHSKLCL